MTEQELDQHRADLQQLDIQDLRCGVMMQLHTIESLTAERDHWKDQHKECTRLLGEALQEATDVGAENDKMSDWWSQMKAERDALKSAAQFALETLNMRMRCSVECPCSDCLAIAALKAVLK